MKKLAIFFVAFLSIGLSVNAQLIIDDDFSSNKNDWWTGYNNDFICLIKDGHYFLEYKREVKNLLPLAEFTKLPLNKDLQIECKIEKLSGIQNNGFGLVWGASDMQNYYCFIVAGKGYYKICKASNNKLEDLVTWKSSDNAKKGDSSTNFLKIEKKGNTTYFYINGNIVNELSGLAFFGNNLGFVVFDKQKIKVDYLKVIKL